MKVYLILATICVLFIHCRGYGGNEERFIKKYAMMKVYESCFGPEVLKEVRKEMKEAADKCSGFAPDFDDKYVSDIPIKVSGNGHFGIEERLNSSHTKPHRNKPNLNKNKKPIHTTDTFLLQQWMEQQKPTSGSHTADDSGSLHKYEETPYEEPETYHHNKKPAFDMSKLQEAIASYSRPAVPFQSPSHQPVQRPPFNPSGQPGSFPSPQGSGGYYPSMYPYPGSYPAPSYPGYPYPGYYPGYYPGPAPYYPQAQPQTPYYRHRTAKISKEFDVKAQIDAMTFHSGAKMRNITCVMQELGYLDDNLEPNYERMVERITRLDIPEELKKDMTDGVEFCKQFSQCVPEMRKDKFQLSRELLRPMFFFRCYKHKKLESCIMKDVRDRFQPSNEEHNMMSNEIRRSFPKTRDDLAMSIFEYMYGANSEDLDSLL